MSKPTFTESQHDRVVRQANSFFNRGWGVIPLLPHEKRPRNERWPELKLRPDEFEDAFGPDDNIGVVLGEPSNGLTDIDLDTPEAVVLAPEFLPTTDRIFGRESIPSCHYLYRLARPLAPTKFINTDGKVLLELRSSGQQTMIPPSVHPNGERLYWDIRGDAAEVDATLLRRSTSILAAAAFVAWHWPPRGQRHEAAMALAGTLIRAGWSEDEVERFLIAAAGASGRDEEAKERKDDVRTTLKKLDRAEPATGLPRFARIVGEKVADKLVDWLELRPGTIVAASTPNSTRATQWPQPVNERAFQGLAGEIVSSIAPQSEADSMALLSQVLVAFGNAGGRNAHFVVESDKHFPNLFVVLVGDSAKSRKGTSWGRTRDFMRRADPSWADNCIGTGLSTGEGLIWAVRDPISKREPIFLKGKLAGFHDLVIDSGIEDKRLLAIETEFSQVLQLASRRGNILSHVLRQAWDSGSLGTITKASPAKATGALVSIIGHVTQVDLRRHLNRTEQANGFANRFIWLCTRRSKLLPDGGSVPDSELSKLSDALRKSIDCARKIGQMRRSEKAREMWRDVYLSLSTGGPGLSGSITSRAEAQVTRLSMIYALLDRSDLIKRQHLEAALAFWDYSEASARYIFGDASEDAVADDILRALQSSPSGMTRTEISNFFHHHQPSADIAQALDSLARAGRVISQIEKTAGRPDERWRASEFAVKDEK